MNELPKAYAPRSIEEKWYPFWESHGCFTPDPLSTAEPYCIVIPPPNITGYLHMGHALQHTLMDVLTRWRRMQGRKTLWLPGTDHAGISTQVVVERQLAGEGTSREATGREAFEKRVWEWRAHSGGTIQKQMRVEGASCDWSRERFTLDPGLASAVKEVFVRLYEEGLIYRSEYIVNWCPGCKTALSDLEAPRQETQGKLYSIRYPVEGSSEFITVATTRPETMLGDTAIAVHPKDERFKEFSGKFAVLPLIGRRIAIVEDEMVQMEFGTGAVKVTPAHDPNDYKLGMRHRLAFINVIDRDGKMTKEAGEKFAGLDRFEARERVVTELQSLGLLENVQDYVHNVGRCDRSKDIIEPLISTQWFLNVQEMAKEARKAVEQERTVFVPSSWTKVYFDWLDNIEDWCISRQLWWGHRIPAWYCPDGHITVSCAAPEKCGECGEKKLEQDPDVLDTWFSSALWPFSTLGWPEQTHDLNAFYPTSVLVTGFDIIFFWVARMMMMGLKFMKDVPFNTVYVTGLVRDAEGQKMSKMKGNVINPLEVFEGFGTDAVRFALAQACTWGNDITLQDAKMEAARNFANKIWNASRFVLLNAEGAESAPDDSPDVAGYPLEDRWILSRLHHTLRDIDSALETFRFHDVANIIYHFFWDDFCDWYLELVKPRVTAAQDTPERQTARSRILRVLETSLRMLHPIMPFLTEELWQRLPHRGDTICLAGYPKPKPALIDERVEEEMELVTGIIGKVRNIRAEMGVQPSVKTELLAHAPNDAARELLMKSRGHIERLARLNQLQLVLELPSAKSEARSVVSGVEIAIPLEGIVDIHKERERLRREIARHDQEIESLRGTLGNPRFRERAPAEVVEEKELRFKELGVAIQKLKETFRALER